MKNQLFIGSVVLAGALTACKTTKDQPSNTSSSSIDKKKELTTVTTAYMDKNIKPTDDFFLFSNGTWVKNNPVPPSESRWGSFNELEASNNEKLKTLLNSYSTQEAKAGSKENILGNYYASYLNMDKRNELGYTPIKDELNKIKEMNSKAEIISVIAEQHIHGISSLFGFGVDQDLMDVSKNISYLGQSGIGLPNKDYYLADNKKDILLNYQDHISLVFQQIGYTEVEAKKAAASVVDFETKLAKSMMAPAEMRSPEKIYNKLSLDYTSKLFDKIDFEQYLLSIGSKTFDSLIVTQPDFVKTTSVMLNDETMESWKNYLTWKTIDHYAGKLDAKLENLNFNFYGKVLSGQNEMKPADERAIEEITNKEFGELLGKAFVEKHFSDNAQKRVNEMVDNLLIVFKERIEKLDWMSAETKNEALNKLNSIGRKLGFPTKWDDYSALAFTKDAYVQNTKNEAKFTHYKNLAKLNQPIDEEKWGMPAHMVNAYYHPLLNIIVFPAGIMQPPFFDENAEDAVNYGRIGMVIGHEFTHGFDDMGSKFAADGSFKNWWTDEDRNKFEKRTGTLGETFSQFCPIDGHCVNPDLTMGENIADLGGLTMAYHAYERTEEFKSGEMKEGFTPAQRFFISYAQLWKINYTEEELKNRIENDSHSPGMYRVNGPLKNSPEFFEAFGVKEGDPMRNPAEKVARIW